MKLYAMESDVVLCSECLDEMRRIDDTDLNPNLWTHKELEWNGVNMCEHCGETGEFIE